MLHVEYDAPAGLIKGDVRELLTELADERLVHDGSAA